MIDADLEQARAALMSLDADTAEDLAVEMYSRWFQAGGIEAVWPESGAYAAATLLAERFESGWTVRDVLPDGMILVNTAGREERACFGEVVPARATAPLLPGVNVQRLARHGAPVPGFWHLWSDGWRAAPPEQLVRLYLPLLPDVLLQAAALVMRRAPPSAVWAAKFLRGNHGGARRDPGLLYLPKGGERWPWIVQLLDELSPLLGGPPVRFAAAFHGAWLADDPGGGRSFGQALSEGLAELALDKAMLASPTAFRDAALTKLAPFLLHLREAA